jgi:hypothetical protein
MTYRVAHLTFKGGHMAQDWTTEEQAMADLERLRHRDDIVCAVAVDALEGQIIARIDQHLDMHWRLDRLPLRGP